MNSYNRIKNIFEGKPVDHLPVMLHNFMFAAFDYGITMEEYRNSPELLAQAHIKTAEKYHLDGIFVDVDTCLESSALGVPTDFPPDAPARTFGILSQDISILLDKVSPALLEKDRRIYHLLEAVGILRKEVGNDIFLRINADQGPFSIAMLLYGMENFMADLLDEDERENLLALIDKCLDVHIRFHKLLKQAGADMTSFGDSSCGPDLISPNCYRTFALPFHQKLQCRLEKEQIQTVCHICGNTDLILEDLSDIGFAGLEIDYKTDMEKACRTLWGKTITLGSLDPSGVFLLGSPADVEKATIELLDIYKGKNIIPGAGCALAPNTPPENIAVFVKTVHSY